MRVSFPAADAAEAVTGEENGEEPHEEEVNAIAPKGGDGTGIGFPGQSSPGEEPDGEKGRSRDAPQGGRVGLLCMRRAPPQPVRR